MECTRLGASSIEVQCLAHASRKKGAQSTFGRGEGRKKKKKKRERKETIFVTTYRVDQLVE